VTSSKDDKRPHTDAPTDAELMSWFDDELDEQRSAEVAQWAEQDERAGDKLAGLRAIGELLRQDAEADERADGIAVQVMAKVRADDGLEQATGEVVPFPEPAPEPERVELLDTKLPRRKAGNDNARTVYGLAAVAAAVALGLFFWGRGGPETASVADQGSLDSPTEAVAATTAAAQRPTAVAVAPTIGTDVESDDVATVGVEVAEVDFGARSGSVFYVSTGAGEADETTAVVWVTDDVAGEGP
jgi:hypothetical protein